MRRLLKGAEGLRRGADSHKKATNVEGKDSKFSKILIHPNSKWKKRFWDTFMSTIQLVDLFWNTLATFLPDAYIGLNTFFLPLYALDMAFKALSMYFHDVVLVMKI